MISDVSSSKWRKTLGFQPHPLLRGGHLQTLAGTLRRAPLANLASAPISVVLPDGDCLIAHENTPTGALPDAPIAILVHGMCGSHAAPYSVRLANGLNERGVRTWRLDMRGCGDAFELCRSTTHAGRSEDLLVAATLAAARYPKAPIWLLGISLGGNQVLKLIGERPVESDEFNDTNIRKRITRTVAVAPPIDLAYCSKNLDRWTMRPYSHFFISRMLERVPPLVKLHPAWDERRIQPRPKTLREFDQAVTAPLGGFTSADDYYERAASAPTLSQIEVPTFVLAAADDPLIPQDMIVGATWSDSTLVEITRHGGHVGYVGRRKERPWMETRIIDWLCADSSHLRSSQQRSSKSGSLLQATT